MRAYTFINSYICGIQVGIQAGHANVGLVDTYREPESGKVVQTVMNWARDYETFVWLDGGKSDDMSRLADRLKEVEDEIPYHIFREPGLGNIITAISFVLTTQQVMLANAVRQDGYLLRYDTRTGKYYIGSPDLHICLGTEIDHMVGRLIEMAAHSRSKSL